MEHRPIVLSLAVLLAAICSAYAEESAKLVDGSSMDSLSSEHQPQKRSAAILSPAVDEDEMLMADDSFENVPYALDDGAAKRSTLFRFGKRGGTLFRFGKRGSLFRFGKRGSLLRFGKRGGALFRFGKRSGLGDLPSDEQMEDKRNSLFRFGKRSDLDLLRDILMQYEQGYPTYIDEVVNKRGVDGFHWGKAGDDE